MKLTKQSKRARSLAFSALMSLALGPAFAQETVTYTYDVHGRLVKVGHGTTGPNANVVSSYTYDAADNRCNVTVTANGTTGTGSCTSGGGGSTTLTLSPASLPSDTVNTAYSQLITASGGTGPYTFTSGNLPTGLSLSSGGTLSGTPTVAGVYNFTVIATDSASNSGSKAYSLTISTSTPCAGVQFNNASSPTVNEGSPLTFTITKSGATSDTCTVAYQTQDSTAKAGVNYTATSGTLSFAYNDTSKTVTVPTIDDHVATTSTLYVDLLISSPSGASTIANATTFGGINNVDVSSVQPPVANSDSYTLQCNTVHTENVVANDTDPQGYPLTITSVWSDGRTSISIYDANNLTISTNSQTGTFNGSYVISDGHGNSATGQLYITVIHGGPGGC